MVERPRGTNDWGPEDMAKRRFVESRFIQLAESFGFREVSTPTFESLELFTAKSGPGIAKELYAFKDQGGRDLALRPEFTASILRFYVSSLRSRPKPLKLYTTGNAFRYEEPQRGRYREFSQLNAEIIGGAALPSDAEALALAIGTMRAIGLKQVQARIGNIGILRSYLPFPPADQGVVLHSLDKRNFPMLEAELGRLGRKDLASPLRKVIELSGDASVLDDASNILGASAKEGLAYLRDLAGLLDDPRARFCGEEFKALERRRRDLAEPEGFGKLDEARLDEAPLRHVLGTPVVGPAGPFDHWNGRRRRRVAFNVSEEDRE